jgi:hypothetical protein
MLTSSNAADGRLQPGAAKNEFLEVPFSQIGKQTLSTGRFQTSPNKRLTISTMIKSDLITRIATEIDSYTNVDPSHIETLRKNLVDPERKVFVDEDEKKTELWVVAEEDVANRGSYLVVYDDTSDEFGLALRTIFSELLFLGYRGNLLGAYRSIFIEN